MAPTHPAILLNGQGSCLPVLCPINKHGHSYCRQRDHTKQLCSAQQELHTAGITHSPYTTTEQLKVTHVASITTPTPAGCKASVMAIAICLVRRSWTERTTRSSEAVLNPTSTNVLPLSACHTHVTPHPHLQACLFPTASTKTLHKHTNSALPK